MLPSEGWGVPRKWGRAARLRHWKTVTNLDIIEIFKQEKAFCFLSIEL